MSWIAVSFTLQVVTGILVSGVLSESRSSCSRETAKLTCGENERIAIRGVEYGVRTKWERPCGYQDGDCRYRVDTDVPPLNAQCSGSQECVIQHTHLNITAISPACKGNPLYRTIHYDCVPEKSILQLCSDGVRTGSVLYLTNQHYPDVHPGEESNCVCSVASARNGKLTFNVIDLILTEKSTLGSRRWCEQKLTLNDSVVSMSFDCSHRSGFFGYREIFQGGPAVTVHFRSNQTQFAGKFFLEIIGSNSVKVECFADDDKPTSVLSHPAVNDDDVSKDSNKSNKGITSTLIGIIIAGVVFVIVIVVLMVCLVRRRRRTLARKASERRMNLREGLVDPFILSTGSTPPVHHLRNGSNTFKPEPVLPPAPPIPEGIYAIPGDSTAGYSTPWESRPPITPPPNQYQNQDKRPSHYSYIAPDILDHVTPSKEPLKKQEPPKPAVRKSKISSPQVSVSSEINANEPNASEQDGPQTKNIYPSLP